MNYTSVSPNDFGVQKISVDKEASANAFKCSWRHEAEYVLGDLSLIIWSRWDGKQSIWILIEFFDILMKVDQKAHFCSNKRWLKAEFFLQI